jgi:SPP1 gp7 family putative phage head morphogenesis protein
MNPLNVDPSRTNTLRAAFSKKLVSAYKDLQKMLWWWMVTEDTLGLDLEAKGTREVFNSGSVVLSVNAKSEFAFTSSEAKKQAFNEWLEAQMNAVVFKNGKEQTAWTATYIRKAYEKGLSRAYSEVPRGRGKPRDVAFYSSAKKQFVRSILLHPEKAAKARILASRTFDELVGLNAAMKTKLNRILVDGFASRNSIKTIAKKMVLEIESMSKHRATLIARTEIVRAQAEGQLDAYASLGLKNVSVVAEWVTAGDDKVCEECASYAGQTFTLDEARGLIPLHPNCRCAWTIKPKKQEKPRL